MRARKTIKVGITVSPLTVDYRANGSVTMIRIDPPINDKGAEMALVPKKDLEAILQAWREREAGKMKTSNLLHIMERWSSFLR